MLGLSGATSGLYFGKAVFDADASKMDSISPAAYLRIESLLRICNFWEEVQRVRGFLVVLHHIASAGKPKLESSSPVGAVNGELQRLSNYVFARASEST